MTPKTQYFDIYQKNWFHGANPGYSQVDWPDHHDLLGLFEAIQLSLLEQLLHLQIQARHRLKRLSFSL